MEASAKAEARSSRIGAFSPGLSRRPKVAKHRVPRHASTQHAIRPFRFGLRRGSSLQASHRSRQAADAIRRNQSCKV